MHNSWDVVVVGGGNAGFSAAQSAREHGARVLLLEKAPREWAGGNSYFTAGAMRTVHKGLDDVAEFIEPPHTDRIDLDPYPAEEFLGDLRRVTGGRCDPRLAEILVGESRETLGWLHELGLRFELMFHRQAYEVDGRFRFWGGLAVGAVGGGKGMIADHLAAAERRGTTVRFGAHVTGLLTDDGGAVHGVRLSGGETVEATSVVLTSGGFEANPAMRSAYLGPGWDLALVRGTPYNTGDGITMALAAGAQPYGHFSGCHSVAWDAGADPTGDRDLTNQLTRGGYPFGIIVNAEGRMVRRRGRGLPQLHLRQVRRGDPPAAGQPGGAGVRREGAGPVATRGVRGAGRVQGPVGHPRRARQGAGYRRNRAGVHCGGLQPGGHG